MFRSNEVDRLKIQFHTQRMKHMCGSDYSDFVMFLCFRELLLFFAVIFLRNIKRCKMASISYTFYNKN